MTTHRVCGIRAFFGDNGGAFPYVPDGLAAPARVLLTYLAPKATRADNGVWATDVQRELGLPWDVVEELLADLVKAGCVLLIPRPNDLIVIGVLYVNTEDEDGWDR